MSGNWEAALSAMLPLVFGMIGVFILCCVALIAGIRIMTKDKILCTFHKNHRKGSALLKYDAANSCVWLGKEDDPNREKYLVTQDEMEWVEWPGMLPSWFCVTIRSMEYVRGVPTPINAEKKGNNANISAKALRLQSDSNVLQAVYLHARQSLGLKGKPQVATATMLLLVVIAGASLFGAYNSMQVGPQMKAIQSHITTIENALGIGQQAPQIPPQTTSPPQGGK